MLMSKVRAIIFLRLTFCFTNLVNINGLHRILQNFEIANIFMLQTSVEFDFFHLHTVRKKDMHELAICCSVTEILDLLIIALKTVIHPVQHIMPADVIRCCAGGKNVDCRHFRHSHCKIDPWIKLEKQPYRCGTASSF